MNLAFTALTRCLLAGALLSLGACAASAGTTADQPTQQASVTLARSTCFGLCPGYTVTVDAEGRIDFTGHAHVQTAKASGHATPAQLASILAAVTQSGFRSMQDSYTSRNDGCEMMMSDQPGVKITVADTSGSKTVDFYDGCTGAAADAVRPRIEQLAKVIDQQLDTRRWIGTPAAPGAVEQVER